jgi:hypothetical protein
VRDVHRGRLINPFIAVIYQLDPTATAAVVGGGYDPEFGEILPVANGTQTGASSRREKAAINLRVQLDRTSWGTPQLTRGGYQTVTDLILTARTMDLEIAGLVDANGLWKLKAGDRIDRLLTIKGAVEQVFDNPPGMYITGFERAGLGLNTKGTPRTNLLFINCAYATVPIS